MSAVICKQRLLHKNKILHSYKCYGVDQTDFRKPLQSSTKNMKKKYPKRTHSFVTDRSIFNYSKRLNCFNVCIILTKLVKLHFLETVFQPLKTAFKFKKTIFLTIIIEKGKMLKYGIILLDKNTGKNFSALKN